MFLGVWLSLGAEDWRQDRIELAAESESLRRLVRDLGRDVEDMSLNLQRASESQAGAREIVAASQGYGGREDLGTALGEFQKCSFLNDNTSEYTALKSSGRLNQLRNPALRQQVVEYYEGADYLAWLHARDCERVESALTRAASAVRFDAGPIGDPYPTFLAKSVTDASALLRDGEFLGHVSRADYWKQRVAFRTQGRITQAREIMNAIEEQLDTGGSP